MTVPFFDARTAGLDHRVEIDAAVARVLGGGRFILGPEVEAFEAEFAAFVGTPHAVGVASGTDALIIALRAVDVGRDDEVVTVANAGVPVVAAIRAVGAVPRFVDVLPDALVLDPARLPDVLTERTRAVLPVHLYGQPALLDPILSFARRHRLKVIEDCAHAHGAAYRGAHVGTFGDVGTFSFYPTKNLGAYGDAGLCVTRDPALARRMRMLRQYGFRSDGEAHCEGINSRMDALQAAILRVKLAHLPAALEKRRELARRYDAGLRDAGLRLPEPLASSEHAYHLYVVRSPDRRGVIGRLDRAGIGWRIHYPVPVHEMEAYRFLDADARALAVGGRACAEVLSLPLHPGLRPDDADRVIAALAGPDRGVRGAR